MAWLFQAVPKRYDLVTRMKEGETETWLTTRYREEMKRGDLVFMWSAGSSDRRGLYGWGRIISDQSKYYDGWGHGIDVHYEKVFPERLASDSVGNLSAFARHVLFKMPIGTNFKLEADQTQQLVDLISERFGREAAPNG